MGKLGIGVVGAAGRMGQRVVALIGESPSLELVGAFERADHPLLGQDSGRVAGGQENQILIGAAVLPEFPNLRAAGSSLPQKHLDVLIIFAPPEAAIAALALAESQRSAVVLGTTGFSDSQVGKIHVTARKIPLVWSANMSAGVNLLQGIVSKLAEKLGDEYDADIIETHHRLKKDAPSGTALLFFDAIGVARNYSCRSESSVHALRHMQGERPKNQIGMYSMRSGETFGEHTIIFSGPGERIELTHRVSSRDVFACGALRAAEWATGMPPGIYGMEDVLTGLRETAAKRSRKKLSQRKEFERDMREMEEARNLPRTFFLGK